MNRGLGGMLAAVLACTQASAIEPATSINDLYQRYVDVGIADGKHKAWRVREASMTLVSMRTEMRYRVPASVGFTFPQPLIDQSAALPIMEAVASDLGRICTDGGGELKFEPRNGIDQPKAERDIKRLQQRKLYGRFVCTSEAAPFEVEVQPGKVVTESHLPPVVTWTLVLATAMPEQILKLSDQQRRQDAGVEAFRRSLKPGTPVAVSAADVPAQLQSQDFKRYESLLRGRRYYVCGLAIDVREPLIQVQVSGGLFYVAANAIRPVKEQITLGGSLPLDGFDDWCLKGY